MNVIFEGTKAKNQEEQLFNGKFSESGFHQAQAWILVKT